MGDPGVADLGLGHVRLQPGSASAVGSRYGAAAGTVPLRDAVAEWQGADPSEVAITTGASLALVATLSTLARPASVLAPRPYYSAYAPVARLLGLQLVTYELERERGWELSADTIAQFVRPDTRALIVNQPHNPTGGITRAATLRQVDEIAGEAGLLVISDETYAGIVFDGVEAPDTRSIFSASDLVRVLSFSKLFGMPGERLGCVITDPSRATSISHAHWHLAMSPPATAQAAALSALRSGPERIAALVDVLGRHRERAIDVLSQYDRLRFVPPAGGCFVWIEVVDCPVDSQSFAQRCHEHGRVVIGPGHLFGVESPVHVRVSFAVPLDELTDGLHRLGRMASSLGW